MTVIENDLAARYAAMKPEMTVGSVGLEVPASLPSVEERERGLLQEAGESGTLASYLLNDTKQSDFRIQSFFRDGKYAEAEREIKERRQRVNDNREGLVSAASMEGPGPEADLLRKRATSELGLAFLDGSVQLPDGKTTTPGQFFESDAWKNPSQSLRNRGFSPGAVAAALNGAISPDQEADPMLKGCADIFVNPPSAAVARARNLDLDTMQVQNAETLNALVVAWPQVKDTFGDGVTQFARRLYETHQGRGTGGAARLVDTLTKAAQVHADKTGLRGEALVDSLFGLYSRAVAAANQVDGPGGTTVPQAPGPDTHMVFDATLVKTMAELEKEGGQEFVDAVWKKEGIAALRNVLAVRAQATANGIDAVKLAGDSPDAAKNFTQYAAEYVRDVVLGRNVTQSPIYVWDRFNEGLGRQIQGARDFVPTPQAKSAAPADYNKLSRLLGGTSTCPDADNMAESIRKVIKRHMATAIFQGRQPTEEWGELQQDIGRMQALRGGLADAIRPYFSGDGAGAAAGAVADDVLKAMAAGSSVKLEESLVRLSVDRGLLTSSPDAYAAIRNWVYGRTAVESRYADQLVKVAGHLESRAGWGLAPGDAHTMMSNIKSRVADLERAALSGDASPDAPVAYLDSLMNRGYVYRKSAKPVERQNFDGTPVVGSDGGIISYSPIDKTWSDDLKQSQTEYSGGRPVDPDLWNGLMLRLAAEYDIQDKQDRQEAARAMQDYYFQKKTEAAHEWQLESRDDKERRRINAEQRAEEYRKDAEQRREAREIRKEQRKNGFSGGEPNL